MALNISVKFEGKLTFAFKNDLRNLANFHQSMFENLKIGTFIGAFYPKRKMYELLRNFDPRTQKTQKIAF